MPRLSAVLAAVLLLACSSAVERDAAERPPNFLVLLVDDLGWTDLGCYGSDFYLTPNIDQLAEDGVRFTHGYAACTVCSPTRAALMTGLYPGRTNVTDWIPGHSRPRAPLRPPDWTMRLEHRYTTLAEALGAAGYRTAHVGKWHLMPRLDPEVMADYAPQHHGFEINIAGNEYGAPGSYYHPYERDNRKMYPLPEGGSEGDYLTDRLTDEAIAILDELDSGLDVDALAAVSHRIEQATQEDNLGVLAITHFSRLLTVLHADVVHILINGVIAETGGPQLAAHLEETGYDPWIDTRAESPVEIHLGGDPWI